MIDMSRDDIVALNKFSTDEIAILEKYLKKRELYKESSQIIFKKHKGFCERPLKIFWHHVYCGCRFGNYIMNYRLNFRTELRIWDIWILIESNEDSAHGNS